MRYDNPGFKAYNYLKILIALLATFLLTKPILKTENLSYGTIFLGIIFVIVI